MFYPCRELDDEISADLEDDVRISEHMNCTVEVRIYNIEIQRNWFMNQLFASGGTN